MPRSNRRCAASLHEVAKCTVPRRWSVSSCASAGGVKDVVVKDAVVAAIAMADARLNDVSLNDVTLNMGGTSLMGLFAPNIGRPYQDGPSPAISPSARTVQLSLYARSATARLSLGAHQKAAYDPALHPTRNGRHLGAADALPDLVR